MQLANIAETEQGGLMRGHEAEVQEAARGLERLLIVRLGSMGDVIHALPAATLLRRAFPAATLAWRATPFSDETWREALGAWREVRAGKYKLALDFQGAVRTAVMARWTGAEAVAGFERPREHAASL